MNAPPILIALRAATDAAHRRLDQSLAITDRLADPARRPALISAYRRLFATIEAAIHPHLQGIPALALAQRCRSARIDAAAEPVLPLSIDTPAAALGALYVAEGATLGGRTILAALAGRGVAHEGLDFLDPYGAESGRMWRALVAVLESELATDPVGRDQAIGGALAGFALAEQLLAPSGFPRP